MDVSEYARVKIRKGVSAPGMEITLFLNTKIPQFLVDSSTRNLFQRWSACCQIMILSE